MICLYEMTDIGRKYAEEIFNKNRNNNVMKATLGALCRASRSGDVGDVEDAVAEAIVRMPKNSWGEYHFPLAYREAIARAIIATADAEGLIK